MQPSDTHTPPLRWYIRHAFDVPDVVSEGHCYEIIARKMLTAHPGQVDPIGPECRPWSETAFAPALAHVQALHAAIRAGDLDVAVCGFGTVSGPDVPGIPMKEEDSDHVARLAIEAKLGAGTAPSKRWIDWLWSNFRDFVHNCPYADGES